MKYLNLILVLAIALMPFGAHAQSVDSQGSEAVVINSNGGFENGKAKWSASAGNFSITTNTADVGLGKASGVWNPAAAAETLSSSLFAVPAGLYSKQCGARFIYKGGDASITASVVDSSANTLVSSILTARTSWNDPLSATTLGFTCPDSGSVKIVLTASADAAAISLDQVIIGTLPSVSISQATLFAQGVWTSATAMSVGSITLSDWTAASQSATYANSSAAGSNRVGLRIASLPKGKYQIVVSGVSIQHTSANSNNGAFASVASDDISTVCGSVGGNGNEANITDYISMGNIVCDYDNTSSSLTNKEFWIKAARLGIANASSTVTVHGKLTISVYRWPTSTEQSLRVGTEAWKVDANISGSNVTLLGTDQTSYVGAEHASLTLTNNAGLGSIAAQIPCSGTNAPTGTTCAVGNESVGVSFALPRAGDVEACASFGSSIGNGAGTFATVTYQLVETASNAQTVIQEGKDRVTHSYSQENTNTVPVKVCGTFSFSSSGQKTLRLMYEQDITTTQAVIFADASAIVGQRDIHWTVTPLTQGVPQPVILNSAYTKSLPGIQIESAIIASGCASVTDNPGGWISSASSGGTGQCTINFTAGTWNNTPKCFWIGSATSASAGELAIARVTTSSSAATIYMSQPGVGAVNRILDVMCVAQR